MTKRALCLWALLVCAACPAPKPPAPPPGAATCQDLCKHLGELGCEAARPTTGGATCVVVCENVRDSPVAWNLDCRTKALTCAAADVCEAPAR